MNSDPSATRRRALDQALAGMDLDTFKDRVVDAHRSGRLVLQRADLVGAMDPTLVARSEVRYLNASFHFIDVEPGRAQ